MARQPGPRTRALVLFGLCLALVAAGWAVMIRMPGDSYRGPLLPLTDEQRQMAQELEAHVTLLAEGIGERNVYAYDNLVRAARYIETTLARAGYEVARQGYEVMHRRCDNLEVELAGGEHRDEVVVIGAHYDSVIGSPGANDNASGVAALLVLARRLAGSVMPRTVRFVAFVNEEPPLFQTGQMGSWVYARRSRERKENVVAMLSLETMGYFSDVPGSQQYPLPLGLIYPSTANFIAFVSNVQHGGFVRDLVGTFRGAAQFPSEGGALPGFLPGVGWSDHWAFWQEGYRAAMVTDTALFRDSAYHTARDTPDRVQVDRLARILPGLEVVVRQLAGATPSRAR